jgi:hypothetical protein
VCVLNVAASTKARADEEGARAAAEGVGGAPVDVREGANVLGAVEWHHHRRAAAALARGQLQRVSSQILGGDVTAK